MRTGGRRRRVGWCALGALLVAAGCGADDDSLPSLLRPPDLPSPPLNERCRPAGGDPVWSVEGEPLSVPVSCALGLALPPDAFELPDLPPGADWDASTGVLTWRPALDQAGLWHVPVYVPSLGESGVLRLGIVDAWSSPHNRPPRWPVGYPEEFGLPVIHLSFSQALGGQAVPARLTHRGRQYEVRLKYRGNQSLEYPKKNFTVKLDPSDPLTEPGVAGGFTRPKLVLTGNFDDASHVRQRLAYELWNRLDPAHVQVRTFPAVVYLNGYYWGLYLVGDHIDDHLLVTNRISREANIYKAIWTVANFRLIKPGGQPKLVSWSGLEKKEGKPKAGEPGAFDDLDALIRFVDTSSDDDFRRTLPHLVRMNDAAHWWMHAMFGLTVDSIHKNVYLLHDPRVGPWRFVPWDFNASFGQDWKLERLPPDSANSFTDENRLFERMLNEPSFLLPQRLSRELDASFAPSEVLGLIDTWTPHIEASARRDDDRWSEARRRFYAQPSPLPWDEDLAYVREWIEHRHTYLRTRYRPIPP